MVHFGLIRCTGSDNVKIDTEISFVSLILYCAYYNASCHAVDGPSIYCQIFTRDVFFNSLFYACGSKEVTATYR